MPVKGGRDTLAYGYARYLGRYVNGGYVSREEVTDAILAASEINGHMHGRPGMENNKTRAQIVADVARALDAAAREGTLPDWEGFDD